MLPNGHVTAMILLHHASHFFLRKARRNFLPSV
jgi:hypothetical protein